MLKLKRAALGDKAAQASHYCCVSEVSSRCVDIHIYICIVMSLGMIDVQYGLSIKPRLCSRAMNVEYRLEGMSFCFCF